jgi:hypothetical protein
MSNQGFHSIQGLAFGTFGCHDSSPARLGFWLRFFLSGIRGCIAAFRRVLFLVMTLSAMGTELGQSFLNHSRRIDSLGRWIDQLPSHDIDNLIMDPFELSMAFFLTNLKLSLV